MRAPQEALLKSVVMLWCELGGFASSSYRFPLCWVTFSNLVTNCLLDTTLITDTSSSYCHRQDRSFIGDMDDLLGSMDVSVN